MATLTTDDSGAMTGGGTPLALAPQTTGPNSAVFAARVAAMLQDATNAETSGRANITNQAGAVTNASIEGAPAYNPEEDPAANVAGANAVIGGFTPAEQGIGQWQSNFNANAADINQNINTVQAAIQPSYTPMYNPNTGLMDGYNAKTGGWASVENPATAGGGNGAGGTSPTTPQIVGGLNVTNYASDPEYGSKIQNSINGVTAQMPAGVWDPETAQNILQTSKSPLSAAMISTAAMLYGIPPLSLMAATHEESVYGTSDVATDDNNPLGVTYVPGMANAVQGDPRPPTEGGYYAKFDNMLNGLYAGAKIYAKAPPAASMSTAQGNSLSTTQDEFGGTYSNFGAAKVQAMPQAMQMYVQAGPLGVAYINSDNIPPDTAQTPGRASAIQTMAQKNGIPVLNDQAEANLQAIGNVYEALGNVQTEINQQLGSGPTGAVGDIIKSGLHDASWGDLYPQLNSFNTLQQTAIAALKALSGGAGSGLRINLPEITSALNSLPATTDTVEGAEDKLVALQKLLQTQVAANFPYTQGVQPGAAGSTTPQGTGTAGVSSSNPLGI